MIIKHTALGQDERMNETGDTQVNTPCSKQAFLCFIAFPRNTITDKLAPVIFSS